MWGVVPIFDRRDPPTKKPSNARNDCYKIDWPLFITYCCNIIYIYRYIETDNITLQWRHNGRDSVSNHQPDHCLLSGLFRRRSKKTSKLRVTCLCAGNSPGTGEFPAQMASNAENVSIWWRHHEGCNLSERHTQLPPKRVVLCTLWTVTLMSEILLGIRNYCWSSIKSLPMFC